MRQNPRGIGGLEPPDMRVYHAFAFRQSLPARSSHPVTAGILVCLFRKPTSRAAQRQPLGHATPLFGSFVGSREFHCELPLLRFELLDAFRLAETKLGALTFLLFQIGHRLTVGLF